LRGDALINRPRQVGDLAWKPEFRRSV